MSLQEFRSKVRREHGAVIVLTPTVIATLFGLKDTEVIRRAKCAGQISPEGHRGRVPLYSIESAYQFGLDKGYIGNAREEN